MSRRRAVALIAAAVLMVGCAEDDPIGDAADAAVGIRASGCGLVDRLGTGALIADATRTVVVTSAHTVAGSSTVMIERGGRASAAALLAIDPTLDLAILTAPGWAPAGRSLTEPVAGAPGRLAIWNVDDDTIKVTATEITRLLRVTIEDIYVQGEYERRSFEIDASIERGDSGAPIVADDGQVSGVVYARSRDRGGVAFAVSATEIEPIVAGAGTEPVDSGRCA